MVQVTKLILFPFEITCFFNGTRELLLTRLVSRFRKVHLVAWLALIATPAVHAMDAASEPAQHKVYVIGNGWHAGLLMPAATLDKLVPGLHERFPAASSYEIGWGDIGFYQAKDITDGLAFQALFASRGSVLHVVGIQQPASRFVQGRDAAAACFTQAQLQSMAASIAESFVRGQDGKAASLGGGIYGDSEFYQAKGRYGLLNTCNRWSATVLQAGGLPIHTRISLTASSVLNAVRQRGQACQSAATSPATKAASQAGLGVPSRPRL